MHIDLSFLYRTVLRPLVWLVLAAYFLFAVGLVVLRYAVLPAIDDYRPQIESLVGKAVGAPVSIGHIAAEWQGLNPSFELESVKVAGPEGRPGLNLPRASAILSWRSLLALEPRLLRLELDAPELDMRRDEQGRYWIAGWFFDPAGAGGGHEELRWLLAQREVIVRGGRARWHDALRAAPPLEASQVVFVLRNAGRHHRAALTADPPEGLAERIDVRADFTHRWLVGESWDLTQWRGSVYLDLPRVHLAGWAPWVAVPGAPEQGAGSVRVWLDYDRGTVKSGRADLALNDVRLRLRPELPPLSVARLSGRVELAPTETGYALEAQDLDLLTDDGIALRPGRLAARWNRAAAGQPESTQLEAAGLDLAAARRLADRLPLPAAARTEWEALRPAGTLDALNLAWQGPPDAFEALSGSARFSGLSIAAAPEPRVNDGNHPQRPGFSNMNGSIEIADGRAAVALEGRDAVLSFPGVFREPDLPVDTVRAQAVASRAEDGIWTVAVERFEFARRGVQASFNGNWRGAGRTPAGSLDLHGRLAQADVREIYRYMPIVVGGELRDWLQRGLLAGQARDVEVRVRGDLDGFPYANDASGEFRVAGKIGGVTLDYLPEPFAKGDAWPRLEGLNGDLLFERNAMRIEARSGRVRVGDAGVAIARARAAIADLEGDAVLEVDGETQGPASAFLAFVKHSPVGKMLDGLLDDATASGNVTVPVSLRVPLDDPAPGQPGQDVEVKGEVRLAGNDFRLSPAVPQMSKLHGAVGFDNRGVTLRDVAGAMLDGPVRLSGGPRPDGTDLLQAEGSASASALRQVWNVPGMARLSGRAAYKASVHIVPEKEPVILLESDLVGLAADLPAPLGKTAEQARPSRLEWGGTPAAPGKPEGDWFAGSLGPAVNLHIERDYDGGHGIRDVRAAIGINRPATISGPGLGISAQLPDVDVEALRKLAAEFHPPAGTGGADGPAVPLNRISLSTPVLRAHGRQLDQVSVYAVRHASGSEANWRVDVESTQLAGRLSWVEPGDGTRPNRLSARLSRLVVNSVPEGDESGHAVLEPDAEETVPEIDLVAEHFELFGKELGRLEVLARSSDRGREWRLSKLQVRNPDAELDGTGVWKFVADGSGASRRLMSLDAVLKLGDAGKFLERMGVRGTMAGGSGTLSAQVSWRGLPYKLDVPSLSGKLELAVDKGQFLKAEPGIAKLLGVLSLQSLPRRVTLDFRDVFSEGFAYDTVRAHARIDNGVAHTDDFKMNGVSATVVMAGDADLGRETQNLRVVVVPKLDAGAASLLYGLAVNPAIGLSVFLAQLLLKDPLSQVLAFEYAVTGSWSDPQVAKLGSVAPAAAPDAGAVPAPAPTPETPPAARQ